MVVMPVVCALLVLATAVKTAVLPGAIDWLFGLSKTPGGTSTLPTNPVPPSANQTLPSGPGAMA